MCRAEGIRAGGGILALPVNVFLAITVVLAIVPELAKAQLASTTGSLVVLVTDISDAAVPGATVQVTHLEHNWSRTLQTDALGRAIFSTLSPGGYKVSASCEQFTSQTTPLTVLLGHSATLRVRLQPAALYDSITVSAATEGAVDSATTPVHYHIPRKNIEGFPINQRNALDFALLDSSLQRDTLRVHAVANTSGFNVMGQRPRSNSLQLDGSDINDETTGGVRNTVPMEAVQEFQVLIAGHQAEFGRASGGVVNIITRSGGNDFHGTGFGFLRHRSLDAKNAFSTLEDPPYTRTQCGGSLGGPLHRDRSFFFAAFEQLRRQESGFSQIGLSPSTFSLSDAQRELKAADPANPAVAAAERGLAIARTGIDPVTGQPPGYNITPLEGSGRVYPISQHLGAYSLRLDHRVSDFHQVNARFSYAHDKLNSFEAQNNDQISGLLSFGRTASQHVTDPTAVMSITSLLSANVVNEIRLAWAKRDFRMLPNSTDPPVNIPGIAFIGREPILPHTRFEYHGHLQEVFSAAVGVHLLKLGADWMYTPVEIDYERETNGNFTFGQRNIADLPVGSPSLTPVQAYGLGLPTNYVQQFGDPVANVRKTGIGLFLQDNWRVGPNLTLELGARYEIEHLPQIDPSQETVVELYDRLGVRRSPPADWNNIQPRFGFSYQISGQPTLLIRGSYGLFYDRLPLLAAYLPQVGDGSQMVRAILAGDSAVEVFRLPAQKLPAKPPQPHPTGIIAFNRDWHLAYSQQGNLAVGGSLSSNLFLEAGYVFVKGSHLGRARDLNYPNTALASQFLASDGSQNDLLHENYFRAVPQFSEVMALEGSASSIFQGLRLNLRGRVNPYWRLHASYTFSKAIDDSEEIFPHSRAQNMHDFRSERGLALYDQRHRFVLASVLEPGISSKADSSASHLLAGWSLAPIVEFGSGRPLNVLLGFDNNLDQFPSSDRPHLVAPGIPGSVTTRFGPFLAPAAGECGNLGRNAAIGPGYASVSVRVRKRMPVTEDCSMDLYAEGFNLLNHVNIRAVNPNYAYAGEPLSAFDPRQVQLGLRLRF
jgi:outer membrane receptor protein involved in Fe transport